MDFATCETIRLSRIVDKEGVRTIGVCTKVDEASAVDNSILPKLLAMRNTDVKLKV